MAPKNVQRAYGEADRVEALYGNEMRSAPLNVNLTAYKMKKALKHERHPPVELTDAVLKQWFTKYGPSRADQDLRPLTAAELHSRLGPLLTALASDGHVTAWKLRTALADREVVRKHGDHPTTLITDGTAKQWLENHHVPDSFTEVLSAHHLEMKFGADIRTHPILSSIASSEALKLQLAKELSLRVSKVVAKAWLSKDWSSAGQIRDHYQLERLHGDRLRLSQYQHCFSSTERVQQFSHALKRDRMPIVLADSQILVDWHQAYHHGAGPVIVSSVADLERLYGHELRKPPYKGHNDCRIVTALSHRPRPVHAPRKVVRLWLQQNGVPTVVMKRPAAASASRKQSAVTLEALTTSRSIEDALGDVFRHSLAEYGFIQPSDLIEYAETHGFSIRRETATHYLQYYIRAHHLLFADSRDLLERQAVLFDLKHVRNYTMPRILDTLREHHGLIVDRMMLRYFYDRHDVTVLSSCHQVHAHPVGEFILHSLQHGASCEDLVTRCLEPPFGVRVHLNLLQEYRRYREQLGAHIPFWQLRLRHWRFLYDSILAGPVFGDADKKRLALLRDFLGRVGRELCARLQLSPDAVLPDDLLLFYKEHEQHVRLRVSSHRQKLEVNIATQRLLDVYVKHTKDLNPDHSSWRSHCDAVHASLASDVHGTVVWPLAVADFLVTASRIQHLRLSQHRSTSWHYSYLPGEKLGRLVYGKQTTSDFGFWVAYGSYTHCSVCQSFFYDDDAFRRRFCLPRNGRPEVHDLLAVPSPPVLLDGKATELPESAYWWMARDMYSDSGTCSFCRLLGCLPLKPVVPSEPEHNGRVFSEALRSRKRRHVAAVAKAKAKIQSDKRRRSHRGPSSVKVDRLKVSFIGSYTKRAAKRHLEAAGVTDPTALDPVVSKVSQMFRCMMSPNGRIVTDVAQSERLVYWPRYADGEFRDGLSEGTSMLDLTARQANALSIVHVFPKIEIESYDRVLTHGNYKKVAVTTASYVDRDILESELPDDITRAAFRYLRRRNKFYCVYLAELRRRLSNNLPSHISSYELFVLDKGIECAIWPVLYPCTECTDTGLREHYQDLWQPFASHWQQPSRCLEFFFPCLISLVMSFVSDLFFTSNFVRPFCPTCSS